MVQFVKYYWIFLRRYPQQAFQAGEVSLNPAAATGVAKLIFKNYAQPGDQMTLSFDMAATKFSSLDVNTCMDDPKDEVTLAVKFATLPDGTNYPQQTVLDSTAKKLQVTTRNSGYQTIWSALTLCQIHI